MTLPTRYAEACERAADMFTLDMLGDYAEREQDKADAADLRALAQEAGDVQ